MTDYQEYKKKALQDPEVRAAYMEEKDMIYNYREAVKNDIREVLENDKDKYPIDFSRPFDKTFEELYDKLWIEDAVTGNGCGKYFKESPIDCLKGNFTLLMDALADFGVTSLEDMKKLDVEGLDVTIRCYLLDACLRDVLEEKGIAANDW